MDAPQIAREWPKLAYIDGQFEKTIGPRLIVRDPCTNQQVAVVNAAGKADIDKAVLAARRAFDLGPWPRILPFERGQFLTRIAQTIEARLEHIARIDAMSAGKPIKGARREVLGAARVFAYYAGLAPDNRGDTIPLSDANFDYTIREPVGVVAQIVPWNFPFLAAAWKLAPALAAGCTSVLKMSPLTPLSALVLGEICDAINLPPGVVNILPGDRDTGIGLVGHQGIDMVSFTGSTEAGAHVMRAAADGTKRVALELGGKSPTLIFADADLGRAANASARAVFGNSGQSCSARSRIYVESSVYDEFVQRLEVETKSLRIGSTLDEEADLGPLISPEHWERVHGYVHEGTRSGAQLVQGGRRPIEWQEGNYYEPTIFINGSNEMRIVREEVFGPVVVVSRMEAGQALQFANESAYGLSASIWTKDITRALRLAKGLRVGSITINTHPSASQIGAFMPFGGFKQSGIGRELGRQGLELYTEIKNVLVGLEF
ncbi:MAG: aldehyde dehydrogenase family protein [Afipia sp.]|nr:aldehyde dehydrogenase family protein [Afipia sp.]